MPANMMVIPDTVFTRALLDGSVTVEGFDVAFDPSGYSGPAASARLRGRIEPELTGAEQVIPDYLVRLARGVGQPLVALPVFLTRGMVHRKYVGRRGGPAPDQLNGKRIGVSRVLAASAVYLRWVLREMYGLSLDRFQWFAAEPFSSDDALAADWPPLKSRLNIKAPELVEMLARGDLDAVLYPGGGGGNWYGWLEPERAGTGTVQYGDLETMVGERPELEFALGTVERTLEWFRSARIYPVHHMIALHRETAETNTGLAAAVTEAFSKAAARARGYLSEEERRLYDREIELLGVDPNQPGLNELTIRSIERLLDTLEADGALERRPSLKEIFPYEA